MTRHQFTSEPFARRARLSSGEIALAIAVTVAAVAFVVTALGGMRSETAAVVDQGQQIPNSN